MAFQVKTRVCVFYFKFIPTVSLLAISSMLTLHDFASLSDKLKGKSESILVSETDLLKTSRPGFINAFLGLRSSVLIFESVGE